MKEGFVPNQFLSEYRLYYSAYQIVIGVEERNWYYTSSNRGGGSKSSGGLRRGGGQKQLDDKKFNCPAPHQSIYEHSLKLNSKKQVGKQTNTLHSDRPIILFIGTFLRFLWTRWMKKHESYEFKRRMYTGNVRGSFSKSWYMMCLSCCILIRGKLVLFI